MVKVFIRKLSLGILCLFLGVLYGQEEQVAFLPGVFELSEAQRAKADVLKEYADGFNKALLFKRSDTYLLKIDFEKQVGRGLKEFPISITQLEELRNQLQSSLLDSSPPSEEVKGTNGRGYLITSTSLHAIAQSRIFSNISFEVEVGFSGSFGPFPRRDRNRFGKALPYFATASAITGSILLTRDKHILPSAANMHFWGSIFGYGHGLLLTSMIREPYQFYEDERLESVLVPGISILEGWLGYQIAKRHNFSYARSKAINSGNFWGGFNGILLYGMFEDDFDWKPGPVGFSGLLGSGVGLFTADRLLRKHPRSSGDISAINMAGIIGLTWGSALSVGANLDGRLPYYALFIGTAGGLVLSGLSTKSTSFTGLEGGLIAVSTIAGGTMGVGLAGLIDATDGGYTFAAAIGMTAGFIVSHQIFAKNEIQFKSMGFDGEIRWNFNPASIGMVMSSPERQANLMRQNIRMDLVGLNYTF